MKFFFSALISLVSLNILVAQNNWQSGYIISFQSDTVYGFIDKRATNSLTETCFFKKQEAEEVQKLKPSDIAAYRFLQGKYFISRSVDSIRNGNPVFLEFIINGEADVFHYMDKMESRFFIEKEGEIYELKNTDKKVYSTSGSLTHLKKRNEYLGVLNLLMADAKMSDDIFKTKLNTKSLTKIAKKYHDKICKDGECIVYERQKRKLKANLSVYSGPVLQKVSFGGESVSGIRSSAQIGARLWIENPFEWQERISILIDLKINRFGSYTLEEVGDIGHSDITYNDQRYTLTQSDHFFYRIKKLDVDLDVVALQIPVSVNYYLLQGKRKPYVGGGLSMMFVVGQNESFNYHRFVNSYEQSVPMSNIGLNARAGSRFLLKGKYMFFAELSYDYTFSRSVDKSLQFRTYALGLNVGYTF